MFAKEYKCSNCGKNGHNYKQCNAPVTSYGIIVFRPSKKDFNQADALVSSDKNINGYEDSPLEFLLIQRRDSLGYIEILRGKYRTTNLDYIMTQINGMTDAERDKICSQTFDELWTSLWQNGNIPAHYHKNEQDTARYKFNELKQNGTFQKLCENATKHWLTPEWGFPKGRRDSREGDLECAIRELWEETGITKHDIQIIENVEAFYEDFTGTNNIRYCHKYFVAYCEYNKKHDMLFNSENLHIAREIGNIEWFTLDDALEKIRPDNLEKRIVLKRVAEFLRSTAPLIGYRDYNHS